MITINLAQIQYGVQPQPDGSKILAFADQQSGIQVLIPLDEASASKIAAGLSTSGVVLADAADAETLRRAALENGQT
jgi:hypothetical protein